MSRSQVYTLHLWPPLAHARHYTGSTRNLPRRLADHALGRGARLPQVQVERGGSWVLAQTEPGGRDRERQLKNWGGATRRCQVCKAVRDFQAGDLSPAEALGRAGWDRASEHERGLLLDVFGIQQPPASTPPRPVPAAGDEVATIPEPRPAPAAGHLTPDIVAVAERLETAWAAQREAAQATAGPGEPEAGS